MSVSDWDNEYARLARMASQLRTVGIPKQPSDIMTLQNALQQLEYTLSTLPLQPSEIQRRKRLIQHLQQTTATAQGIDFGTTNNNSQQQPSQQQTQMTMALRQQDDMIDELAMGVGRLKTQTIAIGDETRLHVNLLNDMDSNLDSAQESLLQQTTRATKLREDQSVWRLQLIVAGLFVLLILLIFLGLTP